MNDDDEDDEEGSAEVGGVQFLFIRSSSDFDSLSIWNLIGDLFILGSQEEDDDE